MENIFTYILQSSVGVALFYLAFAISLKDETFFKANRFFLLSGIVISLFIPLLSFKDYLNGGSLTSYVVYLQIVDIAAIMQKGQNIALSWIEIGFIIYLSVTAFLFLRFCFSIIKILSLAHKAEKVSYSNVKIVNLKKLNSPFSFFNIIFINSHSLRPEDKDTIIAHELAHIRGLHTIDNILIELLICVQWINPFVWFYRKALKSVHEYEADSKAIMKSPCRAEYQNLLLKQAFGGINFEILNNFNISLLKRRIKMLSRKKSLKPAYLKFLALVPVMMLLIVISLAINPNSANAFGEKKQADREQVFDSVDVMPMFDMQAFAKSIVYPEAARKSGIEGQVILKIEVSKKGKSGKIEVVSTDNQVFNQAAIDAAKKIKFKPALKDNKAVSASVYLPVKFRLK